MQAASPAVELNANVTLLIHSCMQLRTILEVCRAKAIRDRAKCKKNAPCMVLHGLKGKNERMAPITVGCAATYVMRSVQRTMHQMINACPALDTNKLLLDVPMRSSVCRQIRQKRRTVDDDASGSLMRYVNTHTRARRDVQID